MPDWLIAGFILLATLAAVRYVFRVSWGLALVIAVVAAKALSALGVGR